MKIKDQTFKTAAGAVAPIKATAIDLLDNLPSNGGVEASRQQVTLARKLAECEGDMELTPEEATLIRSLINRSTHLPPTIQVEMYDAFNPPES